MKRDWVLTQSALNKLLGLFDADPEQAGEKYERMRARLIRFFQWRGCAIPQELADEVLNRVARKAEEGELFRQETLGDYFYGVAQNVLREFWRDPVSTASPLETLPPASHPAEHPGTAETFSETNRLERRLDCLESCLGRLPPETRALITSYYAEQGTSKIKNRQRLAEGVGYP